VRWTQTLSIWERGYGAEAMRVAAEPVELRLRFTAPAPGFGMAVHRREWTELKPGKVRDFERSHAPQLSAEARCSGCPTAANPDRRRGQFLDDAWTGDRSELVRQPLLRPLLADARGAPLVFHDVPVRLECRSAGNDRWRLFIFLVQAGGGAGCRNLAGRVTRPRLPDADWRVSAVRRLNRTCLVEQPDHHSRKAFDPSAGLRCWIA